MFHTHDEQSAILGKSINANYVFSELLSTKDRTFLLENGTVRQVSPGTILCRQDEVENFVYILLQGEVEVVEHLKEKELVLGKLRSGDMFGEIAALFTVPRIATVVATKSGVVLEVPANIFAELIDQTPTIRDTVYLRLYERSLETALRSVPTFEKLNDHSLPDLSRMLQCWQVRQFSRTH